MKLSRMLPPVPSLLPRTDAVHARRKEPYNAFCRRHFPEAYAPEARDRRRDDAAERRTRRATRRADLQTRSALHAAHARRIQSGSVPAQLTLTDAEHYWNMPWALVQTRMHQERRVARAWRARMRRSQLQQSVTIVGELKRGLP